MMRRKILTIETKGRSIIDITSQVTGIVSELSEIQALCHIFLQHTSASLFIGENADPGVQRDLEAFMSRLVPDADPLYKHQMEGPDDMPAHVRSVLTQTELTIPVIEGGMSLGDWQSIFLWEHRMRGFQRHMIVTMLS